MAMSLPGGRMLSEVISGVCWKITMVVAQWYGEMGSYGKAVVLNKLEVEK